MRIQKSAEILIKTKKIPHSEQNTWYNHVVGLLERTFSFLGSNTKSRVIRSALNGLETFRMEQKTSRKIPETFQILCCWHATIISRDPSLICQPQGSVCSLEACHRTTTASAPRRPENEIAARKAEKRSKNRNSRNTRNSVVCITRRALRPT